jgi:rare lipoprotein A
MGYRERGHVTHYVEEYRGTSTASGEAYEASGMTAAHRTLPFSSHVRVTDLATGRSVVVRINDRGPFRDDRLIGLSWAAASQLGTLGRTAEVEVIGIAPEEAGPHRSPSATAAGTLPPRPVPTATSVTGHRSRGPHSVQAGAFRDRSNAERLRVRLSGAGLGVVWIAGGETADDGLYRVLLGPQPSRAAAERVVVALRQWGVSDPVIVAH